MVSFTQPEKKRVRFSNLAQSIEVDIPNNWLIKSLGQIADVNPEVIDESYPHTEILYIDIGSVENFRVQRYEKIKLGDRPSRAQRIVRKNDIIISTVRPNLKAFAKLELEEPNLVCSTGFTVVRPYSIDDADLIFNFIQGHHFETDILRHMEGMAYPAITSNVIGNSLIPYSPNNLERGRIASILSKVDDLIQKTDVTIEETQTLKKSLMQELLTKGLGHTSFRNPRKDRNPYQLSSIPQKWDYVFLGEPFSGQLNNGLNKDAESYGHGCLHVNIENLFEGFNITLHNLGRVSATDNEIEHYKMQKGDICILRSSVKWDGVGHPALYNSDSREPVVFSGFIIRFRPNREFWNPIFLTYLLRSNFIRNNIKAWATVSANININQESLKKIPVPHPQLEEQDRIASALYRLELAILMRNEGRKKLEILKKGLVQKLLTGQIRMKV